jgi:hypothetical protein
METCSFPLSGTDLFGSVKQQLSVSFERRNECSDATKRVQVPGVADQLLASQEGLCCLELTLERSGRLGRDTRSACCMIPTQSVAEHLHERCFIALFIT